MIKYLKQFLVFSFLIISAGNISAQSVQDIKKWLSEEASSRSSFLSQSFAGISLSRKESGRVAELLMNDKLRQLKTSLAAEWNAKIFREGNHELKFEYRIFGEKPKDGRNLFISMHGGGNTRPAVNDQQWKNQVGLYRPSEGVYVAPRAPTNTWNLWHEEHIDTLFDKLIKAAIIFEGVNPDKVYIMGYSAGGDGVYQLAPRMADHWAAASMMAGHPNETSPLSLRNLPFAIHVGTLDNGFNRNEIAKRWAVMLDSLHQLDQGGYNHVVQLHEGRPHWMNREDTVAVPWMASFTRNTIPSKVVWKQDDMHHESFYWLAVPVNDAKTGAEIVASYNGNNINIEKNYSNTLIVYLNDRMMNLNKAVTVNYGGKKIYKGKLKRSPGVIYQTIQVRNDPGLVFPAKLVIVNGKVVEN